MSRRSFVAGSRAIPLDEVARRFGVARDATVRRAAFRLPLRFPGPYLDLARADDPGDPIRRIAWPDPEELAPDPGALDDPVGEQGRTADHVVVRKYPDRALLLVTSRCHFYCRFCFRAGHASDPSPDAVHAAIERLAGERGLREAILSGGDPLTLPDDVLAGYVRRLGAWPDLVSVRIHTRAPVHDPARVTPGLVRALVDAAPRALWIAVHVTHPRELATGLENACGLLQRAGVPLLSQTVLLRGVNADPTVLRDLFLGLYARQVKPYYLHHPDRVRGSARFRVTIEDGLAIYRALRAQVPRPALPAYVLDLPDGSGKVDVEALERIGPTTYRATHPDGLVSEYEDVN